MIDDAKAGHWEEWLETLDAHSVWTAHKYVDGVPLDTRSARVPTLVVPQPDGSSQPVTDNAGKGQEFYRVFFPPPPENLVLPELDDDVRCYDDAPVITIEQIRRCVAKLAPYKAPGSDDIPNVVAKKCIDILESWLYWIFRACSLRHFYWEPWREFVTIVIRKPGRATYTVAKSFRPIVLYRWCPKLYAACVLEGLLWVVETRGLLPATHFGGRAGRCTTDSIHLLVQTVKDAWRGHKVASALFLDVAGAFPNAVPGRLLYNMRARGVPEGYVQIIDMILRDRRTSIRFDDYETDTFDITNGISQGDPLSMILYLFYNSDLLDLGNGKQTLALGFVDDIGLLAVGRDFRTTHGLLKDMMERDGGGCDWADAHNSPWEYDKTHVVDFCTSQKRRALGQRAEDLIIAGKTVKNTTCAKFLGVQLDSALSFRPHVEAAVKKGMLYVSQISRLARTTRGLTGELARRLYVAVAVPRMTYAGDVWFTPIRETREGKLTGSIGFARRLAQVQRVAAIRITGAMRTSPGDLLDIHADLWPARILMDKVCYRSALRMCTLDKTHPLAPTILRCSRRMVKSHPSPIHHLFDAFNLQPQEIETIQPYTTNPTTTLPFTIDIASSRQNGIKKAIAATTDSDIQIYTDGSANEEDVGAAAVLYRDGEEQSALLYHLGSLAEHTVYEAEAVGVLLGLHLLREEVGPGKTVLGMDNTAVILASRNGHARPGQHLINRIRTHAQRAQQAFGGAGSQYALSISWTPGHEGIGGNEAADAAAKMAALSATASSPARALPSFLRDGLPKSKSTSGGRSGGG